MVSIVPAVLTLNTYICFGVKEPCGVSWDGLASFNFVIRNKTPVNPVYLHVSQKSNCISVDNVWIPANHGTPHDQRTD